MSLKVLYRHTIKEESLFSSYEMKRFGNKLKTIRIECDMTQAKVAKLSTVSIDTLRRIENGYVTPRYETLVTLTNIYQKDLLKLFDNYTEDLNLVTYYNQIDEAILENDLSIAKTLYDELVSEVINEDVEKNQVDQINYKQILCFLETRQLFYDKRHEIKNTIEHNIIESIKLRIHDFQLDKFEKYNYTHVELRLLLLLAINYQPTNHLKPKVLIFLNSMLIKNNFEKYNMELRLKILYHLSYTAFRLEDDKQAIQWDTHLC